MPMISSEQSCACVSAAHVFFHKEKASATKVDGTVTIVKLSGDDYSQSVPS